ncbi:MAG: hypothetical protein RMK99_07790 [Anaerolineales bacterium]|nr:hypothetical protein [Anaerolineales bacterium]
MPPLCPSTGFAKRSHAQAVLRGGHPERTPSDAKRQSPDACRSPECAL